MGNHTKPSFLFYPWTYSAIKSKLISTEKTDPQTVGIPCPHLPIIGLLLSKEGMPDCVLNTKI